MSFLSAPGAGPVSLDELVALNDEIVALTRAGVPLELGLRELGGEAGGTLGELSRSLSGRMSTGVSLPEALEAEGPRLPRAYRAVVVAGARAGRLPAALEAVSNFIRELLEVRRQIGLSLVYPLIVCGVAYGLFVVFIVDLLERFRETYDAFHIRMHGLTAALVWAVDRIAWWWWVPPVAVLLGLWWWLATSRARTLGATGVVRGTGWIPGLQYYRLASFAELLALLIEHEVPLPEALRLSADATGGDELHTGAQALAEVVERGETINDLAFGRFGFPPFLHWVLAHAGRGVRPARMLRHTAAVYRRRGAMWVWWVKLLFPLLLAGPLTVAMMFYALAVFGPLVTFWKDLVVE